jgi:hypothetical protein
VNGTRSDENGTVTYQHTAVAVEGGPSLCGLHADWAGRLLDMADAKEQVEAEMVKQGLEPGTVTITFTGVQFEVTDVAMRDAAGNDLTPPDVPSYTGALSIEGDEDIIVIEHSEGGDVKDPDVTVKDSPVLVETVNAAYQSGEEIPGTGTTTAVVDLDTAAVLDAADHPGLDIEFIVKVEAQIGF